MCYTPVLWSKTISFTCSSLFLFLSWRLAEIWAARELAMLRKETQSCLCLARNCCLIQESWLMNTQTKGIKCGLPSFYAVQRLQQSPDDFPVITETCVSSYLVRTIEMSVFGLLRRNSQCNFFFLHALNGGNNVFVWSDFATFAHVVKIEIMLFSFEGIKFLPLCKGKPLRSPSMLWYLKHVSVLV